MPGWLVHMMTEVVAVKLCGMKLHRIPAASNPSLVPCVLQPTWCSFVLHGASVLHSIPSTSAHGCHKV